MGAVSFVYSNPRHHAEMMAPVMAELTTRGLRCRAISLAELRGFATGELPVADVECRRALPARVRRNPSLGASIGTGRGGAGRILRRSAQLAVWAALAPRLAWLMRGSDALVVPNDAAYPYREIARLAARTGTPLVLMQEGIRFPLPGVRREDAYGRGGAAAICAWGESSAEYFRSQGAPPASVHVTGNPRFDRLDLAGCKARGREILADLGIEHPPLLYLSNPIDDQGFCSTRDKLDLFRELADQAAPVLTREQLHLLVKLHPREDVAAFRAAAAGSAAAPRVHVLEDQPLFPLLAAARAAIVLASTVGLEALLMGVPLGVLEVPGAGFVFDYVQSGAAIGLPRRGDLQGGLEQLLSAADRGLGELHARYLERHLAHRGEAARRAADLIAGVRRSA